MIGTLMIVSKQMLLKIWVLLTSLCCIATPVPVYGDVHDIRTHTADSMRSHWRAYKKYVKGVESDFNLLRRLRAAGSWIGLGSLIHREAQKIALKRGCGEKELAHAKILSRFFEAGKAKKAAIIDVAHGQGAEILERVFSQLYNQFGGTIRKTVEIRTALIELLHKEMMAALGLNGSKEWFCEEIERKNHKKQYVVSGKAFDVYLHQSALALFAMYWFENHVSK
jgi:hypothetical protein